MSPCPTEYSVAGSIFSRLRVSRARAECMRSPWPPHLWASCNVSISSYSWNCTASSPGSAATAP
eukprot:15743650-Heterocapsa_arctica.AAC.1